MGNLQISGAYRNKGLFFLTLGIDLLFMSSSFWVYEVGEALLGCAFFVTECKEHWQNHETAVLCQCCIKNIPRTGRATFEQ